MSYPRLIIAWYLNEPINWYYVSSYYLHFPILCHSHNATDGIIGIKLGVLEQRKFNLIWKWHFNKKRMVPFIEYYLLITKMSTWPELRKGRRDEKLSRSTWVKNISTKLDFTGALYFAILLCFIFLFYFSWHKTVQSHVVQCDVKSNIHIRQSSNQGNQNFHYLKHLSFLYERALNITSSTYFEIYSWLLLLSIVTLPCSRKSELTSPIALKQLYRKKKTDKRKT